MNWLYQYFWIDLWTPVWPNLAASAILAVLVIWKLRVLREAHKVHMELTQALQESTDVLHEKLRALDDSLEKKVSSRKEVS